MGGGGGEKGKGIPPTAGRGTAGRRREGNGGPARTGKGGGKRRADAERKNKEAKKKGKPTPSERNGDGRALDAAADDILAG